MGLVSLRKLSSSFTVKSAWTLTSDILCIWIVSSYNWDSSECLTLTPMWCDILVLCVCGLSLCNIAYVDSLTPVSGPQTLNNSLHHAVKRKNLYIFTDMCSVLINIQPQTPPLGRRRGMRSSSRCTSGSSLCLTCVRTSQCCWRWSRRRSLERKRRTTPAARCHRHWQLLPSLKQTSTTETRNLILSSEIRYGTLLSESIKLKSNQSFCLLPFFTFLIFMFPKQSLWKNIYLSLTGN